MNIYNALENIPYKRRTYFKWKFNLWFDQEKKLTEEELLKVLNCKTFNAYTKWERSNEFKHLVSLYLQTKSAQDLLDIYETVKTKASKGDLKAVDMMLKLQREINTKQKEAETYFLSEVENEEDELEYS